VLRGGAYTLFMAVPTIYVKLIQAPERELGMKVCHPKAGCGNLPACLLVHGGG
jgi:hypothetical protein